MSQRRAKGKPRAKQAALDLKIPEPFTAEHIRNAVKKLEEANVPKFDGEYFLVEGAHARAVRAVLAETQAKDLEHLLPPEKAPRNFLHVDDFIDAYDTDHYASFVLALFRFPAVLANKCADLISRYELFCKYKGRGYRVTGCSRMGDVWLSADFTREVGYELRVNVADCSDWCPNKP